MVCRLRLLASKISLWARDRYSHSTTWQASIDSGIPSIPMVDVIDGSCSVQAFDTTQLPLPHVFAESRAEPRG